MFNAVINTTDIRERRLGSGAILSISVHAVIFAVLLYGSTHKPHKRVDAPEVVLKHALPPPPPPPLGGASRVQPVTPRKPLAARNALVITKDPPKPTPIEEAPSSDPSHSEAGGQEGGKEGGKIGGQIGGEIGGTGTALPTTQPPPPPPPVNAVLPFGEGMNRPTLVSGPRPVYPREAREAKVEGTMLVKCVISTAGTLRNCRVLKSLPFMEQPVLEALAAQRYTPVTFQGRPVDVEYVIPFKFTLER